MTEMTWGEIYKEYCEFNPVHAAMICDYRPWGKSSILVWFKNGHSYKITRQAPGRFIMQLVSDDDINKKYGLTK